MALEYTRELGLEFHAGYRMAGFHYPPPYDADAGYFFKQHPELRGTDKQGNPNPRISYAYEETRQFVLSILREIASYPVDGISL